MLKQRYESFLTGTLETTNSLTSFVLGFGNTKEKFSPRTFVTGGFNVMERYFPVQGPIVEIVVKERFSS